MGKEGHLVPEIVLVSALLVLICFGVLIVRVVRTARSSGVRSLNFKRGLGSGAAACLLLFAGWKSGYSAFPVSSGELVGQIAITWLVCYWIARAFSSSKPQEQVLHQDVATARWVKKGAK